jgi:hypothetical protein
MTLEDAAQAAADRDMPNGYRGLTDVRDLYVRAFRAGYHHKEATMIDPETRRQVLQALEEIAADMKRDATQFDGRPFNGRTVAELFGNQGAAIAALARIVKILSI